MPIGDEKAKLVDKNGNPTAQYSAYLKYEAAYKEKLKQQNEAYSAALVNPQKLHMWPIIGKQYNDDVNDAMNKWTVLGFKNEIESTLNILKSQGFDMSSIKQNNN